MLIYGQAFLAISRKRQIEWGMTVPSITINIILCPLPL